MRFGKKCTLGFLPSLLVLIAMLVTACGTTNGPTGPAKAPASQQHLRIDGSGGGAAGDIATFDPAIASDASSINAIEMVFSGLVMMNTNLQAVGELAQSWSHQGTTWTFHLKPNLKFSDGTALTAQDVAYSINRALSPAENNISGGLALTYLGLIKDSSAFANGDTGAPSTLIGDSIIVKDASTLQLILSHNTGYFLQALAYATSWVVEKSLIDKWGDKWTDHLPDGGGSGPWRVLSYSHNTGIKYVPNPNYFGPHPQLSEVDFEFYKTAETSFKAYQANQIDQAPIPSAQVPTQKAILGKQFHQVPQLWISYINLNFLYKPLDNIKIRQALELALNKDVLNQSILNGVDTPTCHIVPNGMPGYDANLKCPGNAPTSGDPTMAKQLLQEGLQEEGLTSFPKLNLTYPANSPTTAKLMTTILQMWQTVLGITIGTDVRDFNTELKAESQTTCTGSVQSCVNQGLAMWSIGWIADYPDPQDWLTLQFGKGAGYNQGNYGLNISSDTAQQQQVQTNMDTADRMDVGQARLDAYNAAEQQLVNDVAWLSLDQVNVVYAMKTYVAGWFDNPQGSIPPAYWANIYISVH